MISHENFMATFAVDKQYIIISEFIVVSRSALHVRKIKGLHTLGLKKSEYEWQITLA